MKDSDLAPSSKESPTEALGRRLDPDPSAYFLVRRPSDRSDAASPKFGSLKFPYSYPKSPKATSQKSGGSSRGLRTRATSISSAQSTTGRGQAICDWNANNLVSNEPPSTGSDSNQQWVDPPRPPREGYEWVWFPEGYWAERELPFPKNSSPKQKWWNKSPDRKIKASISPESPEKFSTPIDIPRIRIGSLRSRNASSIKPSAASPSTTKLSSTVIPDCDNSTSTSRKNSLKAQDMKNQSNTKPNLPVPAYNAIHTDEQLGLYCRTKKNIRSRFLNKSASADDSSIMDMDKLASQTTQLLQGTSQYLDRVQRQRCQTSAPYILPDDAHTPGSQSSRSTRKFGLAPWHRRSSYESILSVSSSVFRLLLGKAPAATPIQEFPPQGIDGRSRHKVDTTSPDPVETNFLPSEAKRVNTPPMFPGTPAVQPRGFFFDLNPRRDGSASPTSTISNKAAKSRSSGHTPGREWWEADVKHAKTGNKSAHPMNMDAAVKQSPAIPFELSIPEHLPSSPLCPKNPMHQSGGTGTCPYHGRKSSSQFTSMERLKSEGSSESQTRGTSTRNFIS
ncbi:uncharacterized protein RAG0_02719 [Rhynchosporium agropyri]|uniref:Uncharacterized protein n=1 Tax=Rhynchosporium agropyri TaxID=914238 RepID=A0A1E1K6Q1_9HELO|nr:uncharacterized protein RAG0_02719 [Rhynchosporium agropyri]